LENQKLFKSNSRYLIKTPTGFETFSGIQKKKVDSLYEFTFGDDSTIRCSGKHAFLTEIGFLYAEKISLTNTISGKIIKNITLELGEFDVYDPVGVKDHNSYYAGGVINHNTEFLGSSRTLINGKKLAIIPFATPIFISDEKNFKTFEASDPLKMYCIVVDTARGNNGDYSAFIVVDITQIPYKIVATFRDNTIDPMVYPSVIRQTAVEYNNAMVLVETNDIGAQVSSILLHDLEYENVLRTIPRGRAGVTISDGGQGEMVGLRTTLPIKKVGCLNLKTIVEKDRLIINDYNIVEELSRFVQKGASYEAEQGHDDLVMCCVLFAWMTAQVYFENLTNLDLRRNLLNEMADKIDEHMLPFCFKADLPEPDYTSMTEVAGDFFDEWMKN
jgi:hypothetical protein